MEAVLEEVPSQMVAQDELDRFVNEMKKAYPQHKLSFGYIGNMGIWRDDRSFRIFTKYTRSECRSSESYHLGSYENLSFNSHVELQIRKWIESLDRKVSKGLLYSMS